MMLHLDLDSFFASAERSINPSLENIPIAVGSRSNLAIFDTSSHQTKLYNDNSGAFVAPVFYTPQQKNFHEYFVDTINDKQKVRGIITTASYEARAFGIKTGMSINESLLRCPHLQVLPPNYILYHKLSHDLGEYLQVKIPNVEQFSIDEFFGDVTGWISDNEIFEFAKMLQEEIYQKFKLPISIGISKSKWIAKLATEFAKPKGVLLVKQEDVEEFIKDIDIKEFPGIGRGMTKKLVANGITKLGEIKKRKALFYSWKTIGIQLYNRIHGIDNEPISPKNDRKSIGISRTFDPLKDREEMVRRSAILARNIVYIVYAKNVIPTTYSISVKYDFGQRVKHHVTLDRLFSEPLIKEVMIDMFRKIDIPQGYIIKLSMSVSNFSYQKHKVLSLLEYEQDNKRHTLTKSLQKLREKYSLDIIKTGGEL